MLAIAQPFNPTVDVRSSHRIHRSTVASSYPSIQLRLPTPKRQPPPPPTPSPPPPPPPPPPPDLNIHSYPAPDLLRLLASLLTQIAATNDALPPPPISPIQSSSQIWPPITTASRTALSTPSSTLTFHARNIPTISLEAYLLRILKYCPTTNEVFLALLVYFDRMAKLSADRGFGFVIDSYNIHRLVIAGVTVASKFFSDVFYTNSRYAKVFFLSTLSYLLTLIHL
ncbi:cyclin-domain-containing protein [Tricholoma matsutake]|nr:cyclin-domain-containing protein [Tricholoma matsutake 945]